MNKILKKYFYRETEIRKLKKERNKITLTIIIIFLYFLLPFIYDVLTIIYKNLPK